MAAQAGQLMRRLGTEGLAWLVGGAGAASHPAQIEDMAAIRAHLLGSSMPGRSRDSGTSVM